MSVDFHHRSNRMVADMNRGALVCSSNSRLHHEHVAQIDTTVALLIFAF